jgi:hypothetical protein
MARVILRQLLLGNGAASFNLTAQNEASAPAAALPFFVQN